MLIYDSQSSMETATKLTVLRIPSDKASLISLEQVPLINIGLGGISKEECRDFEQDLGHIPNLQLEDAKNPRTFSWAHRTLVRVKVANAMIDAWNAEYMMCMCLEAEASLPANEHVRRILKPSDNSRVSQMGPSVVYGDLFVFRTELEPNKPESKGLEEPERAKYFDMDRDFAEYANGGLLADTILRKLLFCSPNW